MPLFKLPFDENLLITTPCAGHAQPELESFTWVRMGFGTATGLGVATDVGAGAGDDTTTDG